MTTYLVTNRIGPDNSVSVLAQSAKEALSVLRELEIGCFKAIVLDDRGGKRSVDELEAAAAIEERECNKTAP